MSYVNISEDVLDFTKSEDVSDIIKFIESSIKLITDKPLDEVIQTIDVDLVPEDSQTGRMRVDFYLIINKKFRSIVFGRKFSNISAMKKLLSNISGKRRIFYSLTVEE